MKFKKFVFTLFIILMINCVSVVVYANGLTLPVAPSDKPYYFVKYEGGRYILWFFSDGTRWEYDSQSPTKTLWNKCGVNVSYQGYLSSDGVNWTKGVTDVIKNNDCAMAQVFVTSNLTLYDYDDGSIFFDPDEQPYEDYYIDDNISFFSDEEIENLLNMQKRWEYNLKTQFFIRTFKAGHLQDEEISAQTYGNTKKDSGRGSILFDIIQLDNGNYRLGVSLSGNFLKQLPYQEHYRVLNPILNMVKCELNYNTLYRAILDLYESILWDPLFAVGSSFLNPFDDVLFTDFNVKFSRDMVNKAVPVNYQLVYGKLSKAKKGEISGPFPNLMLYVNMNDSYGLIDKNKSTLIVDYNYPCENCDNHIWFLDLENPLSSPTPQPTVTPVPTAPEGTGNNPIFTPKYTVPPTVIAPEIPDVKNRFENTFDVPILNNSYNKILGMNIERGVAPVIHINLHSIFTASLSKINPGLKSPFSDENSIFIDFGLMNKFEFLGIPIVDYFYNIFGFAMILFTLKYIYDKIFAGGVMSD